MVDFTDNLSIFHEFLFHACSFAQVIKSVTGMFMHTCYHSNSLTWVCHCLVFERNLNVKRERQCTHKQNIEVHLCYHCSCGKAINIGYSECVSVALGIQHAKCICCTAICGLFFLPHFTTLSHKLHDFLEKVFEYEMCVLIFSTNFLWNVSHFNKNWVRCYHKCTYVKYLLFLSDVNETWIFLTDVWKILKYQI